MTMKFIYRLVMIVVLTRGQSPQNWRTRSGWFFFFPLFLSLNDHPLLWLDTWDWNWWREGALAKENTAYNNEEVSNATSTDDFWLVEQITKVSSGSWMRKTIQTPFGWKVLTGSILFHLTWHIKDKYLLQIRLIHTYKCVCILYYCI